MELAIIGLGRMGGNMARRLSRGGHKVFVYNRTYDVSVQLAKEESVIPFRTIEEIAVSLQSPRIVWLMIPAGDPTEDMIHKFLELLTPGDILVDGGNANFNDSIRRAKYVEEKNLEYLDVGVSGGVWGLENGYALMVGGKKEIADSLAPIFKTLAPGDELGWGWVGPHGAGHFVKMVHNGIEYGMMEALAEGFELMKARKDFDLDLHQVSKIWENGSVVRSWLLELTTRALKEDANLDQIKGWVSDSGEGRWTVFEGINLDVPMPVIAMSLYRRFYSRQEDGFAGKLLAAMRNQFGGHAIVKQD